MAEVHARDARDVEATIEVDIQDLRSRGLGFVSICTLDLEREVAYLSNVLKCQCGVEPIANLLNSGRGDDMIDVSICLQSGVKEIQNGIVFRNISLVE